ncbi:MAG: type II toxin-antitoxin system VapC family toxin [bacterium]
MRVLPDTSAYAAWKRGDAATVELVRRAEEILFSAVVAGELHFGFRRGSRERRSLAELEELLASPFVRFLDVTATTADRFGRIAFALRKKGRPIPTNDIWIAAHAMEFGADLVSFDRHFEAVDGLVLVRPGD